MASISISTSTSTSTRFSILIINPNTSTHMTDALKPIVENLQYTDIQFDYFTAPDAPVTLPDGRVIHGIPSINSGEDSARSALHCRPFVEPLIPKYDAFLVACYSAHPLVGMLKHTIRALENRVREDGSASPSILGEPVSPYRRKYVTGIFEASVATSLMLISSFRLLDDWTLHKGQATDTFGIVTTGSNWKSELTNAVTEMILRPAGQEGDSTSKTTNQFAGVETTGLTAGQLHDTPPDEVRKKMRDATERLLKSTALPVSAVCLGCAGMAGMEEAVREGCIKAYGEVEGQNVHIIDGVVTGVGLVVNACKASF
jgi:Asp/Glu/hydantoin racemase